MKGRVLIIAGSDPSGGAGLQADIKTVTALGGYGATAITAITVQNTTGVSAVHPVSPAVIRAQIHAVLSDIGADAVKIGMIGGIAAAEAIVEGLNADPHGPVVLDPVLVATSGDALAEDALADFIADKLLTQCDVITPNVPEATRLTGIEINTRDDQREAACALLQAGARAVLLKGGHVNGENIYDLLITADGEKLFTQKRIATTSTHGTGCTLASAIATGLAQELSLETAVERAIAYVRDAIETAPGFGEGAGPLNHGHVLDQD